jgi:hypothetical protein
MPTIRRRAGGGDDGDDEEVYPPEVGNRSSFPRRVTGLSSAASAFRDRLSEEEFQEQAAFREQEKVEAAKHQEVIDSALRMKANADASAKNAEAAAKAVQEGNSANAAFILKQLQESYKKEREELLQKIKDRKFGTTAEAQAAFTAIEDKYKDSGLSTTLGVATTQPAKFFGKEATRLQMFSEQLESGTQNTDVKTQAEMLKLAENKSNIKMIKLRNYLIKRIRREYGPDIALKVGPPKTTPSDKIKNLINDTSSITDVLNMMSFLINEESEREHIKELSIESGAHDAKGEYLTTNDISAGDGGTGDVSTWSLSLTSKPAPFDINTLKTDIKAGTTIYIPQGIIKRGIDYAPSPPITLIGEEPKELFIECVKQLMHISDSMRTTFSGWTKFVQETSGGGSRSKSKTKKKHNHDQDK